MRLMVFAQVVALALMASGARAQTTSPNASPNTASNAGSDTGSNRDEIVVTGERLHTILRDFVGDISTTSSGENQIARWDHRICTGVFGMTSRDQAQFVADRIAQRAFAAGLDAGGPGCRANIVIFVTPDAHALAQTLAANYRNLLAVHHDLNVGTRGQAAVQDFVSSTRPVRWWHVTETVSAEGFRLNSANGHLAFNDEGSMNMGTQVRVFDPSRLRQSVRQDFNRVILVVDARQAAGKRLDALADYLAMVSLAQLSSHIETAAYPSVLNLFSSDQSVTGMTRWDVAYLDGLYHATRQARSSAQQEGEITERMNRTLNSGEAPHAQDAPAAPQPSP